MENPYRIICVFGSYQRKIPTGLFVCLVLISGKSLQDYLCVWFLSAENPYGIQYVAIMVNHDCIVIRFVY